MSVGDRNVSTSAFQRAVKDGKDAWSDTPASSDYSGSEDGQEQKCFKSREGVFSRVYNC